MPRSIPREQAIPFELTQVGLNQVWMQHYHEKLPRIFASTMKLDRRVIGFLTDEHQPAIRYCSMGVSPLDVIVRGGDEVYHAAGWLPICDDVVSDG